MYEKSFLLHHVLTRLEAWAESASWTRVRPCRCHSESLFYSSKIFLSLEIASPLVPFTPYSYRWRLDVEVFAIRVKGLRERFAGGRQEDLWPWLTPLPHKNALVSQIVVDCLCLIMRDTSKWSARIRLLRFESGLAYELPLISRSLTACGVICQSSFKPLAQAA